MTSLLKPSDLLSSLGTLSELSEVATALRGVMTVAAAVSQQSVEDQRYAADLVAIDTAQPFRRRLLYCCRVPAFAIQEGRPVTYGSGHTYGDGLLYGETEGSEFLVPLPRQVISAEWVEIGSTTYVNGADCQIEPGWLVLPQRPSFVGQYLYLALGNADLQSDDIYEAHASLLLEPPPPPTSESTVLLQCCRLVAAALRDGLTYTLLGQLISLATGVPFVENTEEILTYGDDSAGTWIATPTHIYRLPRQADPVLSRHVTAGTFADGSPLVVTGNNDNETSVLISRLNTRDGGLRVPAREVTATWSATSVRFDLGASSADQERIFLRLESEATRLGTNLRQLILSLLELPGPPATVSPLNVLLLLGLRCGLVVANLPAPALPRRTFVLEQLSGLLSPLSVTVFRAVSPLLRESFDLTVSDTLLSHARLPLRTDDITTDETSSYTVTVG